MKAIYKAFGIDAIYGLDAETYWASDYTLSDKKRGTTEYVTDPRFELQLMSVQKDTWDKPRVMTRQQFRAWHPTIDWRRTGMLAHHAHFDGLIASHHFGVRPKAYFDTLSMARPLMPVQVGGSLKRVCAAFGITAKQHSAALTNTKGKRWAEFTKAEQKDLKVYAGDDNLDMWQIFRKMLPFYSIEELRLIDMTVKMYAQPILLLDKAGIEAVLANEHKRKDALMLKVGVPKTHLTSKPKFAELLRDAGVEPPSKISVKQSEKAGYDVEVFAMSKQDQEFKDLMGHPSERVRDLVAARFDLSSNQMVSRCQLLAGRAHLGPQPVYLNYYGAKTGRWSGADNANWQNLSSKRKEGGAELRASVYAPPGYSLIIADLAQIEARLTAWFAGQQNKVDAFRAYDAGEGPDVYRLTAADIIYNKPIDDVTDLERFVGKTCELALGFQAGWKRLAATFRIGAFGPPMPISDADAKDVHAAWRAGNQYIVSDWKTTNTLAMSAFAGRQSVNHKVVRYEGTNKNIGWMHLPGGMAIRYDGLEPDEEGKLSYISAYRVNKVAAPTIERTRLYGGILVENRIQALARRVIGEHMLNILSELKYARIAMSTHDEIVTVVPTPKAERALAIIKAIMSTPPSWAPDLPLAVDAHASLRYDK